jgi:hypothetical protein
MALCQGVCPGAIPGNRTIPFSILDFRLTICDANARQQVAHQPCSRISKIQPVWGSTTATCQIENPKSQILNFIGAVAEK